MTDDEIVTGYGITLDTLNYFLIEQHARLIPQAVLDDVNDGLDLTDALAESANQLLEDGVVYRFSYYYQTQAYLILDQPVETTVVEQISAKQAQERLQQQLTTFYGLSTDPVFQTKFAKFLAQYAGRVELCDFD